MTRQRSKLTSIARTLRSRETDAERLLWRRLRDRRLAGNKFRRQFPIGEFVVDFVCIERNLVIELDGGQHLEAQAEDQERDRRLAARGMRVLRFWNNQVLNETDAVLEVVRAALMLPSP